MKITVINGNARHGSTWHSMDTLVKELAKYDETHLTEFFLPRDMPHFCNGCFSCLMRGEASCPHASSVTPIVSAMLDADVIILTSPVYAMDVSGQMKALLDHLCFMWMSHRPNPEMFLKIGITITTTAGAGLGHTAKTLQNSLKFWGVKKIFSAKYPVAAMKWDEISDKKKVQIKKAASVMAKKIAKDVRNKEKLPNPLFRSIFFKMMVGMMKKNTWNPTDRQHWQDQGWLNETNPF
jgi:multimeric flavodoxin WrbA